MPPPPPPPLADDRAGDAALLREATAARGGGRADDEKDAEGPKDAELIAVGATGAGEAVLPICCQLRSSS